MSLHLFLGLLALVGFLVPGEADAAAYPDKPVRLIVPSPTGGGVDYPSRVLAQRLGEKLGQQIVVDNRTGGGGLLGSELSARARPDGYTLLIHGTSFSVAPSLYKNAGYDPLKDFEPITLAAVTPLALVVHPSVPASNLKEFLVVLKARGAAINMAYGGNGGIGHLAGELFRMMVQMPFTGVAYRGTGPALVEVAGGQVQFMFATLPGAIPLIGSGKIRALAVTSIDRVAVAKDVPTMDESGLRGYQITNWYGILTPARTPSPIVERLHKEIVAIVQQPDIRTKFAAGGVDPLWSQSPQEFRSFLASEVKKWAKVVQASGMKVE